MSVQFAAVLFLIALVVLGVFKNFGKVFATLVGIAIIVAILVGWCAVFSFNALSGKTLVATVKAAQVANTPHEMAVEMTTYSSDGTPATKSYELGGDLWSLQVQTVELQSWELALGFKSGYQLDRLDSECNDPSNCETTPPVLLGSSWTWFDTLENNVGLLSPVVKSAYGSMVVDPADGREYDVYVDQFGDLSANRV